VIGLVLGLAAAAVLIGISAAAALLHLLWRAGEGSRRRRARRRRGTLDLRRLA
jgi:hypothetical protein